MQIFTCTAYVPLFLVPTYMCWWVMATSAFRSKKEAKVLVNCTAHTSSVLHVFTVTNWMQFSNRRLLLSAICYNALVTLTVLVLPMKCVAASCWLLYSPAFQLTLSAVRFHMRIEQNHNLDSCRWNPKQLQISATVTCYGAWSLHCRIGNLNVKHNSLQMTEENLIRRKALPQCSSAPIQLILISLPFYCWKYKRNPLYLNAPNGNKQYDINGKQNQLIINK